MWATPSKFKLYVSLRICLLREKDVPAKPHPHATCLNFDFDPCIIGKLISFKIVPYTYEMLTMISTNCTCCIISLNNEINKIFSQNGTILL